MLRKLYILRILRRSARFKNSRMKKHFWDRSRSWNVMIWQFRFRVIWYRPQGKDHYSRIKFSTVLTSPISTNPKTNNYLKKTPSPGSKALSSLKTHKFEIYFSKNPASWTLSLAKNPKSKTRLKVRKSWRYQIALVFCSRQICPFWKSHGPPKLRTKSRTLSYNTRPSNVPKPLCK